MTNKAVTVLNDLIETSKDGEQGFQTFAEDAKSVELKTLFNECAAHCADSVRELQQMVRELGGDPATKGSLGGALHRGWTDVRAALSANDDAVVLSECERSEDMAKKMFSEALQEDLPPAAQTVVRRQYEGVVRHHDRIRTLRDTYAARRRA